MSTEGRTSLAELALLFSRLGVTAFGGPAAHIAMMEDEVVRRRGWLSKESFLDLLGATNLIPGPNSTEMAIHIGWVRRRFAGLLVAGVAFILPGMLLTAGFGWMYIRYGSVPSARWLLYGIKPVIVAVVLQAIWGLVPKAARNARLWLLAGAAIVATLAGLNEIFVLFAAGAVNAALQGLLRRPGIGAVPAFLPALPLSLATAASAPAALTLSGLFWVFLKIGSVLFGSGYVLLAFLRADFVERLGWLTEAQLIDAVAVGQVTPGPVFTTATFIGYLLAGWTGAVVATVGIFLPAFVFVALSGPLVPKLRASAVAGAFLDGVNVASLALMAVVTAQLARAALVDWPTVVLTIAAAVLLVRYRVNATWLIAGGAACGWLLQSAALV